MRLGTVELVSCDNCQIQGNPRQMGDTPPGWFRSHVFRAESEGSGLSSQTIEACSLGCFLLAVERLFGQDVVVPGQARPTVLSGSAEVLEPGESMPLDLSKGCDGCRWHALPEENAHLRKSLELCRAQGHNVADKLRAVVFYLRSAMQEAVTELAGCPGCETDGARKILEDALSKEGL